MKYKTKSIIISRRPTTPRIRVIRKRETFHRPFAVALFDIHEPHKSVETPKENLLFKKIHRIIIKDLNVSYLPKGSDILIDYLQYINIEKGDHGHLIIEGKQNKKLI